MTSRPPNTPLRWRRRFGDAFDGLKLGIRTQESVHVHLAVTVVVVILASVLRLEPWRWCMLLVCIASVISLELMNSAIERLVKTLHPEHDQGLAETLHMAAGAVLVAAIGSIVIGLIVLLPPLLTWIYS